MDFIGYNLNLEHNPNINISSAPLVILLVVLVVLMIFYVILIIMTVLYELFEDIVISVTQILYRKSKKKINPDCDSEKQISSIANDIEIDSNPISIELNVKDQDENKTNEKLDCKFNKLNEINNEELSNTVTKIESIIQNDNKIDGKPQSDEKQKKDKRKLDIILNKLNHIALKGLSKENKEETQFSNRSVFVI